MQRNVYMHIAHQYNDPILERKVCPFSGEDFPLYQSDRDLLKKLTPVIAGKEYLLPGPVYAPSVRHRLHLMYKNERHLYHTTCDLTGKKIITRIHPDIDVKTFSMEGRASDDREYTDYGKTYTDQSVLSTIKALARETPYQDLIGSLSNLKNNSTYTNYTADVFNCYLIFDSNTTKDSAYCTKSRKSTSVFDCHSIINCENCYSCVDCSGMFDANYCYDSSDCTQSSYLIDCHGCTNCIGCTNLINKEYHIFSQPATPEVYKKFKQKLQANRWILAHPIRSALKANIVKKATHQLNTERSYGENLRGSSDCAFCTNIVDAQSLRYCDDMSDAQDCWGVTSYGHASSRMYNSSQVGRYTTKIWCCATVGRGENLFYCIDTKKSKNCFGCVNLKQKEYCIFNTQYTKEEYEKLVPGLIESMQKEKKRGQFLPSTCTIFPYNDSVANDIYPIHTIRYPDGVEEVINNHGTGTVTLKAMGSSVVDATLSLGGEEVRPIKRRTKESEINIPKTLETKEATDLPRDIIEVTDEILNQAIMCIKSGRPFRITAMELLFYRKTGLPLPIKHPDVRHAERVALRAGYNLYLRLCDKTKKPIVSVYPPTSEGESRKIFCDDAYNQAVYG